MGKLSPVPLILAWNVDVIMVVLVAVLFVTVNQLPAPIQEKWIVVWSAQVVNIMAMSYRMENSSSTMKIAPSVFAWMVQSPVLQILTVTRPAAVAVMMEAVK